MSTNASLQDRVTALEQLVTKLAQASGEPLAPNFLTVDPNGLSGANFSGHIAAQGVDLPAGTSIDAPANDARVRWLRTSDQALVASTFGSEVGTADWVEILGIAAVTGNTGNFRLVAENHLGTHFIVVTANASDSAASMSVLADGTTKKILDSAGTSDYAFALQTSVTGSRGGNAALASLLTALAAEKLIINNTTA